jgi:guanylate kinase
MSQGHLFIISGPSGVGKSILYERLRKRMPSLGRVVTYTTREPRPGEKNGIDYHFVSHSRFKEMIAEQAFFEWAHVHNHLYGTPKQDTLDMLEKGINVVIVIDVQGAANIKRLRPQSQLIFIEPDDVQNLIKRLKSRRMIQSEMDTRLENAKKELAVRETYDYVVTNREGHLDETVRDVAQIIMNASKAQKHLTS